MLFRDFEISQINWELSNGQTEICTYILPLGFSS